MFNLGGVTRKITAVVTGFVGTWLGSLFNFLGAQDALPGAMEDIEGFVYLLVFAVVTFVADEALKRVRSIFPGDWIDLQWKQAAGQVAQDNPEGAKAAVERDPV